MWRLRVSMLNTTADVCSKQQLKLRNLVAAKHSQGEAGHTDTAVVAAMVRSPTGQRQIVQSKQSTTGWMTHLCWPYATPLL